MRNVLLIALLTVCWAPLQAKPLEAPVRHFQGQDLFALQVATDPQIRPDGRAVAYVRVTFDVMTDRARQSIWLVDAESGEQMPLVTSPGSHFSPRWSPNADRLAYVSTADKDKPQLFVRWMQNGQTAKLADLTSPPRNLEWSPDGKWIAFAMFAPDEKAKLGEAPPKPEGAQWAPPLEVITEPLYRADGAGYLKPGYTHVYVVPAEGGAPRQLTFGPYNESGPIAWTPDSQYLIVTGNRNENWRREPVNSELYKVSLADGSITALTSRPGPDTSPAVSPDGKTIAYLSFEDRYLGYQNVQVHLMSADGSNQRSITSSLDRTVDDVAWSRDGRSLYIQYDDQAITKIARLSLNGRIEPVAEGLSGSTLPFLPIGGNRRPATLEQSGDAQ